MVDTAQTSRRATYDILRHYCQPEQSVDEIIRGIDKPENGIYLDLSAHNYFDKFRWCLKPTEVRRLIPVQLDTDLASMPD